MGWAVVLLLSVPVDRSSAQHLHEHEPVQPVKDPYTEEQMRNMLRSEGMPEATIEVILQQRKELLSSGRKVEYANITEKKNHAQRRSAPVPNAVCADMGGENGWGAWQAEMGSYGAGAAPAVGTMTINPTSPSAPRFNLTSGNGVDPCTPGTNPGDPPVPVVAPGFGNASIQLGEPRMNGIVGGCNTNANAPYRDGCAEQLTYLLTVTPADTNFLYAYAAFIDEPDQNSNPHTQGNAPYVGMCIYDSSGTPIPCGCIRIDQGSLANGFFQAQCSSISTTPGIVWYKPWTVGGINLAPYIGQTLTVVLTNVDCAWGGHFAFSYWDFTCQTPVSPISFCPGQSISLCANPPVPGNNFTYQWYVNGNPYPNGNTQCITPIPQQGDTFTVNIIQPSGCNFKMMFPTQINTIQPGFTYSGTCGQLSFSDQSTSSNSTLPISTWNWQFPGGTPSSSTAQNPGPIQFPPGTYTVSLIVSTSQGCPDTIQQVITMGGYPTAAITSTAPCLGGLTQLNDGSVSAQGDPIVSWNWNIPGGSPSSSTAQNPSTNYTSAGTHTVTLIVTTQQGCKDTIAQQVLVYNPPVASFSGPASGCAPVCNNYLDLSTSADGNITSWQWSFPGGNPASSSQQTPPQICYQNPGSYSASIIVTSSHGCSDTLTLPVVQVHPWPTAEFCVSPAQAPTTNPVFTFCDMWSSDVTQWTWNFGDNDSDNVQTDPAHSYSAIATGNDFYSFNICLNVQNQFGCWDTVCHPVELIPEFTFYIPNCFTPNGDFLNEDFFGKSRGVKEYNIWVFDRWGNLIWDCHREDKNTNWDHPKQDGLSSACRWEGPVENQGWDMNGNSRQLVQEDVYVWKVQLLDIFDKRHNYIGHVSVVR